MQTYAILDRNGAFIKGGLTREQADQCASEEGDIIISDDDLEALNEGSLN